MGTSPLITTAAITSVVSAAIALLVAFGVHLTADQTAAILGFITVLAPWVVAFVGHRTTTPRSAPTDEDGVALVRAGTQAPTLAQTRAALK